MEMESILPQGQQEVYTKALTVPEQAKAVRIVDDASYESAAGVLLRVKDLRAEIAGVFGPIIKRAHEAHKEALAQQKKVEQPLVDAEAILKPQMVRYLDQKEKERRAEATRLEAEARKLEEDARLEAAAAAEATGDHAAAEAIFEQPLPPPPVVVQKTVPKVSGISSKEVIDFVVEDEMMVPDQYKVIDMVALRRVVTALGEKANIPGVRVFKRTSIAAGGRR